MVVGSLFSGAGLLDAGLHQAGVEHAWFVEREPDRRDLLAARWPGRPVHDDVRSVGAHNLERVDGIVGGFPCKGASNAGPRNGFDHPETALWAEFARIVRELRPRYVAVENVAAIRSLHSGAVWGTVLGDLAAMGYDVAWGCVRASDVGAPHGRDRIFAVARHATSRPSWPDSQAVSGNGERGLARSTGGWWSRRPGGADGSAPADTARDVEGRPGAQAGADRERARPRVDSTSHAAVVGYERFGAAWAGRDGSAHGGEVASDAGERGQRENEQRLSPRQSDAEGLAVGWGNYGPAIRRWERVHGAAPEPLVRRLDDGGVRVQRMRARVDRQRLSALGDGVHVAVARILGEALMELWRADNAQA